MQAPARLVPCTITLARLRLCKRPPPAWPDANANWELPSQAWPCACKSRLLLGPPRASTAAVISPADADDDKVVALMESTFEKEVGQERSALVKFYAPWCGHCKKLALEYEKLGASFKKAKSVLIAKVLLVSPVWPLMVLSVSDCPWDALQIRLQPEMLRFQHERVVYLLKDIECLFIVLSNITMLSILVCSFLFE